MSRDDYKDPGAAVWPVPCAKSWPINPETDTHGPGGIVMKASLEPDQSDAEKKVGFDYPPQPDHNWRDLKITAGRITGE